MVEPIFFAFKTARGNQYVYDVCTNRVMPAPEPLPTIIKEFKKTPESVLIKKFNDNFNESMIKEYYQCVKNLVEQEGAFYTKKKKASWKMNEREYWQTFRNLNGFQLILVVTENCNFRCKYCVYGDHYCLERNHSDKRLSFAIAQKAIDYYLDITSAENVNQLVAKEQKVIGFYGGEPLLEFDLIKECVEYVKRRAEDPAEIAFHITTNGSLLTEKVIEFFAANNFVLIISLDGPKDIHDAKRITKKGHGTFETIEKNLFKIKSLYPEYFKKRVMTKATIDYKTDLEKINAFFSSNRSTIPRLSSCSFVSRENTTYYNQFSDKDIKAFTMSFRNNCYNYFKDQYTNPEKSNGNSVYSLLYENDIVRSVERIYCASMRYSGTCLPGRRLTVDPDGNYHFCEKINGKFSIGNYKSGIRFDKVQQVFNKWQEQVVEKNNCAECIAQNMCDICFALAAQGDNFSCSIQCEEKRNKFMDHLAFSYSFFEEYADNYLKRKSMLNGTRSPIENIL